MECRLYIILPYYMPRLILELLLGAAANWFLLYNMPGLREQTH